MITWLNLTNVIFYLDDILYERIVNDIQITIIRMNIIYEMISTYIMKMSLKHYVI